MGNSSSRRAVQQQQYARSVSPWPYLYDGAHAYGHCSTPYTQGPIAQPYPYSHHHVQSIPGNHHHLSEPPLQSTDISLPLDRCDKQVDPSALSNEGYAPDSSHQPGDKWKVVGCDHGNPECLGEFFNEGGQVFKMVAPSDLRPDQIPAHLQQNVANHDSRDQPHQPHQPHQHQPPLSQPSQVQMSDLSPHGDNLVAPRRVSFAEPMAQVNSPGRVNAPNSSSPPPSQPNLSYGPAFVPSQEAIYNATYDHLVP